MLRKLFISLSALSLTLFLLYAPLANADTQDFAIKSFTADYYLSRDADLSSNLAVTETIVVEFPSFDQNRGILRALPKTYQNHSVELKVQSVTDDAGATQTYNTDEQNDNSVLRIGDANSYVRGLKTYVIKYSLRNVISFPEGEGQDEFYWNVNGNQWPQTMDIVTARFHIPSSLANTLIDSSAIKKDKQLCFSGAYGSKDSNCTITSITTAEETLITISASNLEPNTTLTFDIGFAKGTFAQGKEVQQSETRQQILIITAIIIAVGIPLFFGIRLYRKWQAIGKDPKGRGVIIPEYLPPKGLSVLESSFMLDQKLETKAISALFIDLAVRHYLTILETVEKKIFKDKTNYSLQLIKDPSDLTQPEKDVLNAVFDNDLTVGKTVALSSLKNKLFSTISSVQKSLGEQLFQAGYFRSNSLTVSSKYLVIGAFLMFGSFILGQVLIGGILGIGIFGGLIVTGILYLIAGVLMPARSEQGVTTRDYLLGLKEYMERAEAERLQYLQSPQGAEKIQASGFDPNNPTNKVKLFETLLPYAMLFGIEKEWAKEFKDLYAEAPSWYNGSSTAFNTLYLASALGSFSTATSTSFSAPSSSNSSGFGGGGFSGGGGGGGGGGGW